MPQISGRGRLLADISRVGFSVHIITELVLCQKCHFGMRASCEVRLATFSHRVTTFLEYLTSVRYRRERCKGKSETGYFVDALHSPDPRKPRNRNNTRERFDMTLIVPPL